MTQNKICWSNLFKTRQEDDQLSISSQLLLFKNLTSQNPPKEERNASVSLSFSSFINYCSPLQASQFFLLIGNLSRSEIYALASWYEHKRETEPNNRQIEPGDRPVVSVTGSINLAEVRVESMMKKKDAKDHIFLVGSKIGAFKNATKVIDYIKLKYRGRIFWGKQPWQIGIFYWGLAPN